ncbi:MAG: ferritin-like domain-containing protein [Mycoplasmoidaceae bacterium]
MKKDKNIVAMLNKLYNLELQTHGLYIVFSSHLDAMGLKEIAKFVKQLAVDKTGPHNERVYDYLKSFNLALSLATDNLLEKTSLSIEKKPTAKANAIYLLEKILKNEMHSREFVAEITEKCLAIKDYETFEFIQWYIKDYIKDISEIKELITIIKDENISVFDFEVK